eukprot:gene376-547_t
MRRLFMALAAWLVLTAPASAKPLVVLLADAAGTEVTDLLAPYAILAESGAVDVRIVSSDMRPVRLMPGVAWVRPQMTLSQLERRPDVIIVPALMEPRSPTRAEWLREQSALGSRIMSICQGAEVLADAGLFDGRQATAHWFHIDRLRKGYPKVTWRQDVRWITDGPITSTSGVTASAPASLNLLRELAGEAVMRGDLDYAGGNVVHIASGVTGLVASVILGPRKGFGREVFEPHNIMFSLVGVCLLWVGWFGFNGGSAVSASTRAGMAMLVTHISASIGGLSWLAADWVLTGVP